MPKLTIFTAPKPFTDPHIDIIQRNAIQSWLRLGDDVDVLLIGQEEGLAQVAEEYGVRYLPNVEKNDYGTPLVSSIFKLARQASQSDILVYVNADIIFLPDFTKTVLRVYDQVDDFLAVGRRWDVNQRELLKFDSTWSQRLEAALRMRGRQQRSFAIDYFVFPRNIFTQIPEFAIGRAGWDNWMIYHAREKGWTVVDLSPSLRVVHQNHDYGHLPDGKIHFDLEESHQNVELGGGTQNSYSILDANRALIGGHVRRQRFGLVRLLRSLERWMVPDDPKGKRWYIARRLRKLWVNLEGRML